MSEEISHAKSKKLPIQDTRIHEHFKHLFGLKKAFVLKAIYEISFKFEFRVVPCEWHVNYLHMYLTFLRGPWLKCGVSCRPHRLACECVPDEGLWPSVLPSRGKCRLIVWPSKTSRDSAWCITLPSLIAYTYSHNSYSTPWTSTCVGTTFQWALVGPMSMTLSISLRFPANQ